MFHVEHRRADWLGPGAGDREGLDLGGGEAGRGGTRDDTVQSHELYFSDTHMRMSWATLGLLVSAVAAHELDLAATLAPPAVVVRASYGGTQAVAHAKVQVFAPGGDREFQTGTTDRRGYFSFVPEGEGAWRVAVDDEEGHRRELTVSVPRAFAGSAAPAAPPRWERLLAGLALIAGATGVLYGVAARRRTGRD